MSLVELLTRLVAWCHRRAPLVVLAGLILAVLAGLVAWRGLGISTDTDKLFAASLPWRQQQEEMKRLFPQFTDLIVVVIDGSGPEVTDATAAALARKLAADKTHFRSVRRPDALPFFRREGLLFLDKPALEHLLNRTIDAQPFLGQLAGDPSARGLFSALSLVAMGVGQADVDLTPFAPALKAFHEAIASVLAGHADPLSWQSLIGGGLADKAGKYRFVLAQPNLDYGVLEPGGAATDAVRAAAKDLPFVKAGLAHVRITGSVALSDEEFASVAQGAVAGAIGSALLVLLWLWLAVRSWRMMVPIMLTLALGLLLTTGFAAVAVGTLNLVSVAFAVLFIGIAVDFGIQFCVRLREMQLYVPEFEGALAATARHAGAQILVAAAATASGFLAFVPTDFNGVAELGLIAGIGMLIAFVCTVTFLPALLGLTRPVEGKAEAGMAIALPLDAAVRRGRIGIVSVFAAIAVLGVACLPRITFDSDPLHTKNPNTEAMRTLHDLMGSPLTSPYSADVLAKNTAAADELAPQLRALPEVAQVLTLDSFVPDDQQAKLALIADAANVLQATLAPRTPPAAVTADQIRLAANTAWRQIEAVQDKLKPGDPLLALAGDLQALEKAPDATLLAANTALTEFLPQQIDDLRTALSARPVTRASLPPELTRDWLLPDGRTRVQVMAKLDAQNSAGLHRFVAEVRSIAPDAAGSAVIIVDTAATITGAFRTAAMSALAAIAVILFLILRRPGDVALVLAPLLLSALMTALVVVLLPLPLNFANIIALPLLLGVGVSFNIYFVMNWRAGQQRMLGSPTMRAIVFSALTTGTAFGSLALSHHPGTASMGKLLLVSLASTLVATLVFVPAMLAALGPAREN
jgi:hopanoid biosynthesis associated RND transporter like protein HpnN